MGVWDSGGRGVYGVVGVRGPEVGGVGVRMVGSRDSGGRRVYRVVGFWG